MRPTVTDQVAWSVGRSVSLSVTVVSPAKTAEPIEMPFGLRTRVGPRNHIFDVGQHPPMGRDNFEGEGAAHWVYVRIDAVRLIVKYRDILQSSVQKQLNRW